MSRADGRSLTRVEVRLASLAVYHIYASENRLTVEFDRAGAQAQARSASPAPVPPPPSPVAAPVTPEPMSEPVEAVTQATPVPAAARPDRPKATRVTSITHAEEGGQLAVTVSADGALGYEDFTLADPHRVVLDLPGVTVARRNVAVDDDPVLKVRVAQFSDGVPRVGRVVVDLARETPYRIVEASDGLKILFDRGGAGVERAEPVPQEPLAIMKPALEPVADVVPAMLTTPTSVSAPPPALVPVPALPDEVPLGGSFEARSLGGDEKKYTGHPISMDFKDGDLQDIFRLFADISGLNVVVNPGVSGKVTLKLTEIPWDQALDLILKTNGLGYQREDNVIRIARLSDLQKEEAERRKLADEAELAGELSEVLKPISYARAKALADVVKKSGAVSRRGSIQVDERTNTIIIKDLPRFLERAKALINELDRPTRQVEIEARIVVTTRNFSREVGIQWGFLNKQTPRYGNSRSDSFPNTLTVGGAADPTQLGPSVGQYVVNLPATAPTSGVGVSMGNIIGSFNLDAALGALERQGRGRILSTPKITTQDNQEAEIKQGLQFPILVEQNNTVTLVYKDATLTLKVTPQITEAGTVILNVTLENNAADFSRTVRGAPSIQVQEAKTVVLVNDGETAVVGGVYKSQQANGRNDTPLLSKIPLLGYLFKSRSWSSENQELLLFITPHIVKG
jgi:type IV pilus assembly protein PilQ